MINSSEIDPRFDPASVKTKDYKIGICYFSAKHVALRAKTGWLRIGILCPS